MYLNLFIDVFLSIKLVPDLLNLLPIQAVGLSLPFSLSYPIHYGFNTSQSVFRFTEAFLDSLICQCRFHLRLPLNESFQVAKSCAHSIIFIESKHSKKLQNFVSIKYSCGKFADRNEQK